LIHPKLDYILRGTTMSRLFDMVEAENLIPVARGADISEVHLLNAQGVFMIGTTLDILPVRSYESKNFAVSPMTKKFLEMIQKDQTSGVEI
jgi:branched-subunit amino acid aminotransferase/4-amino-4-deoxychorismate lyase